MTRPEALQANVWSGSESPAGRLEKAAWGLRRGHTAATPATQAPPIVDERDWRHPEVGWGIILPDSDDVAAPDKAVAADAPDCVRRLLNSRPGAVVLRYRPELERFLRRSYTDRDDQDLAMIGSEAGTRVGQLPRYLMIFGSPSDIPWSLQYLLNLSRYVGRVDPTGPGWENYIEALIADWPDEKPDVSAPVVWSVNYGGADITRLMAAVIADPLWGKFSGDPDTANGVRLKDDAASGANLLTELHDKKPAFVVTTSHGMTGPADDADKLVAQLGVPVDSGYLPIDVAALLSSWKPNGAIWYAHACCSAGSDSASRFDGLFEAADPLGSLLNGVSNAAGARVAPLAQKLLGAQRPARAFVGHVEPTFDWTLRDPTNRQPLASAIVGGLYSQLFRADRPTPIGFALAKVYHEAGAFFARRDQAEKAVNQLKSGAKDEALYAKLVALDRQNMVIIGDPAVSLPIS